MDFGINNGRLRVAAAIAAILVFGAAFFWLFNSSLDTWIRVLGMLACIAVSGTVISWILQVPSAYGLLVIKGDYGLGVMEYLGEKYPSIFREIADLGLSACFGLPYSFYVLRKQGSLARWFAHVVVLGAFFYWISNSLSTLPGLSAPLLFAVCMLLGLAGFGLAIFIVYTIGIFMAKSAPSSVSPAIPGITLPLGEGLVALFLVMVVHEVAHGVLAKVEGIPIKSSGMLLWGFLPIGAFVEPDEKKLRKAKIHQQRRVLVAGGTSNLAFAVILVPIIFGLLALQPFLASGQSISSVPSNGPGAGLLAVGSQLVAINGVNVTSQTDTLSTILKGGALTVQTPSGQVLVNSSYFIVLSTEPGSPASLTLRPGDRIEGIAGFPANSVADIQRLISSEPTGRNFTVSTQRGPVVVSKASNGKIGVSISTVPAFYSQPTPKPGFALPLAALDFIATSLELAGVLSLGLAIINELPLSLGSLIRTDGYQIIFAELTLAFPGESGQGRARMLTSGLSYLVLFLIAVNLFRWLGVF